MYSITQLINFLGVRLGTNTRDRQLRLIHYNDIIISYSRLGYDHKAKITILDLILAKITILDVSSYMEGSIFTQWW